MTSGTTGFTCRLHGLDVASPFVLGHPAPEGARPDIRITVDDARLAADDAAAPHGRLVAASTSPLDYQLLDRGAEGFFYRIRNYVDIDISPDQSRLHCRLAVDAPEALLPVMLAGHVLSTLMFLRGDLVFHASAVEMHGAAIALVGNSGAGKSTLAALACHQGARLVADDVLRVEWVDSTPGCYRGAASLRLRPSSKALTETTNGSTRDVSADGRHLLSSEPTPLDRLPLAAVFIPRRCEAGHPIVRTALDPRSALFALVQYPRVHDWTDPRTSASQFDHLAKLVQQVPVYYLDIPWVPGAPIEKSWFDSFTDLIFETGQDVGTRP